LSSQEIAEIQNAPKIGVLAYQGDVQEHVAVLESLGVRAVRVKIAEHLDGLAGLIIPGGESTTIGNLLRHFDLDTAIKHRYDEGLAVMGTCAGLILMATDIDGSEQPRLGLMDITASRNAFGRQVQSFETPLDVPALGGEAIRSVFIRAPYISRMGEGVESLATFDGKVVLARQGRLLAVAFHPELVGETRVHQHFIDIALGRA